jgi:uroporphyrinogen decarboxylase
MNSRERVLASLNHQEPDKIPVDFSGHRSSGISAVAYSRLRKHLRLPEKSIRVYDMVQQLAIVHDDVLDLFGVDTIEMGRGFLLNDHDWKPWELPDGTPCEIPNYIHVEKRGDNWHIMKESGLELGIQKKGCLYFEQNHFPLMEVGIENADFSTLAEDLGNQIWSGVPHPGAHLNLSDSGLEEMRKRAKALREKTDKAIIGLFGGNMFELPQMLFRMDNYLMDIYMYPDKVLELSEKLCAVHMANLEKWLGAVGDYIDVILFGDDLGGQSGPLIGPDTYREFYKPYHKQLWNRAKELADVKTLLHCCGGIYELLPDLIEAGIDAINPIQISSGGMDPKRLKKEFGNDLTFWGGGCDTQTILPDRSPAEVAAHVRENVSILAPGGGFVFQQVHNILANVPSENIARMFDSINVS